MKDTDPAVLVAMFEEARDRGKDRRQADTGHDVIKFLLYENVHGPVMNPIPLDSQSGTEDYTRGFNAQLDDLSVLSGELVARVDGYYSALGQIEDTEAKPVERIPDYWTSDHAPVYLDEQPDPAEFDANAADTRASVLAEVVAVLEAKRKERIQTPRSPSVYFGFTEAIAAVKGLSQD
jgi:hypothetical protein